MITTAELNELKAMTERMAALLARVEAVAHSCAMCGERGDTVCRHYGEIPDDAFYVNNECDQWAWSDIPF